MTGKPELSEQNDGVERRLKGFDDFDLRLGDIMRGERATLGKSLLDVQRELRIKATYIAAIENTDPTAFDTPGFVAGYVRSYARYLNLDPEWAFQTFCDEGNFQVVHGMSSAASVRRDEPQPKFEPGEKKPAHLRDPFTEPSVSYLPKHEAVIGTFEPRALASIAVLLALLVGIGYGGWSVLQEVQKVRLTPIEQTPEILAELDPLSAATAPIDSETPLDEALVSAPDRFDRLYRPEALDVPILVARDGPISSIDPDSVGLLASNQPPSISPSVDPRIGIAPPNLTEKVTLAIGQIDTDELLPAVQVVEASAPSVTLLAVRPSWVRIRATDGTVVFEKILDAGEEFKVPLTEEPATLRAGNSGSLYFAVNGQTYGPAGDGPGVIKDVVLEPDALIARYARADMASDSDLQRFVDVAEAQSE